MKFDYGDQVLAKTKDDHGNLVEKEAVVVSITTLETQEQTRYFERPLGTVLYTVEFGDGTDALIAQEDLRALT